MKRITAVALIVAFAAEAPACSDTNPSGPDDVGRKPIQPPRGSVVAGLTFVHDINDSGPIIGATYTGGGYDYVVRGKRVTTHLPTIWNSSAATGCVR